MKRTLSTLTLLLLVAVGARYSPAPHPATEPARYVALLSQVGTDVPTAIVHENTLGCAVTLTRFNSGAYLIECVGQFPAGRVWMNVSKATLATITSDALIYRSDDDTLTLETQVDGQSSDEVLSNTAIEIRVYPEP